MTKNIKKHMNGHGDDVVVALENQSKPEQLQVIMQMPPRARTSRTSLEAGGEEPRPPAQEGRGSDRRRARARARAR